MGRLIVGLAKAGATGNQPKALDMHLPSGEVITVEIREIRDSYRAQLAISAPESVRVERRYDDDEVTR